MELSNVSQVASGTLPKAQQADNQINQQPEPNLERQLHEEEFSKEAVVNKVNELNDFIQPTNTSIKFQLHDKLNEFYVQIIDTNTEEVVKEIPSKKFLDRYAATAELLGFMVDRKV
ncbi:flagellar protein FlaG [Pseudalkalibacillus hwajinpoensis]|uniref:Flagellar protein FlaG n=1 Tax=Guptibacillus hwajinpoensis TaxID=208199 RepID=A0A4U1MIB0_9BACL|nr:flagellar protein FlaG [Pseudalkalibacillus hwajinpoensis]TKD70527.1 flagellar protein FlaG [Pseudalkalibacillus hwajinpoensis]